MKTIKSCARHPHKFVMLVLGLITINVMQSCDSQLEDEMNRNQTEQYAVSESESQTLMTTNSRVGFQGTVFNSAMTQTVANATITFSKSDENYVSVASSDPYGSYMITLKPGSYYVTVTATGFTSYSSAPGYFVVTGVDGYQTGNFFLENEQPGGFQGVVFNATDYNTSIPNTFITFTSADNSSIIYTVFSGAYGEYKISLPQGGYYVKAQAPSYEVYDTTPGLFVVNGSSYQTGNIFLYPQSSPPSNR